MIKTEEYNTIVTNTSELHNFRNFNASCENLSSLFQTEILDEKLGLTEIEAKAQVIWVIQIPVKFYLL